MLTCYFAWGLLFLFFLSFSEETHLQQLKGWEGQFSRKFPNAFLRWQHIFYNYYLKCCLTFHQVVVPCFLSQFVNYALLDYHIVSHTLAMLKFSAFGHLLKGPHSTQRISFLNSRKTRDTVLVKAGCIFLPCLAEKQAIVP